MSFSRRRLEKLIDEIREKSAALDEVYVAVLKRWRDDERAIVALRDIIARGEKAYGVTTESDVAAFIELVLKIRWYAEKTDRDSAELVRLRHEIKRFLPKECTMIMRALRKRRISFEDAKKRMMKLDQMDGEPRLQPPVRSSKNDSRIRTLFMKELSDALHENGALWMDEQVAAIASMVLECEIDSEQVRNTRRR
jgi:hypothetical protein